MQIIWLMIIALKILGKFINDNFIDNRIKGNF